MPGQARHVGVAPNLGFMMNIYLILILPLLLTACSKTCLINKEKVSPPTSSRSGIPYVSSHSDLRQQAWWEKLKNNELNQLMGRALSCNDKIKSAYATIAQAQAQLKAAQSAWLPTLDASANGFSGRAWDTHINPQGPLHRSFLSNLPNPHFQGYYAGFVPGYTFNVLNNINNIKAAGASLAIQQAETQSTKLSIISQMSGAYFMLLSQREQLASEKILRRDLKALHHLEHVRFKKGANDIEAVINIDQQLAQEETKIPQIENIVAQSENTIHWLLNENPGEVVTTHSLMSLNIERLIPHDLPSTVLKNRPDIIIAMNNVRLASAQVGIAYSAFFPTISLTGLVGNASLDLKNLLSLSTNIWIARALGSTGLFDPSSYQKIKAAKADFRATYYSYLDTLHGAFKNVDDTLMALQKNKEAFRQTERGYLAAKQAYDIAMAQYKAGAKDYRNVLIASVNLDKSRLTLIQEKAQVLDSIVQVYSAVGGGSCLG